MLNEQKWIYSTDTGSTKNTIKIIRFLNRLEGICFIESKLYIFNKNEKSDEKKINSN